MYNRSNKNTMGLINIYGPELLLKQSTKESMVSALRRKECVCTRKGYSNHSYKVWNKCIIHRYTYGP